MCVFFFWLPALDVLISNSQVSRFDIELKLLNVFFFDSFYSPTEVTVKNRYQRNHRIWHLLEIYRKESFKAM